MVHSILVKCRLILAVIFYFIVASPQFMVTTTACQFRPFSTRWNFGAERHFFELLSTWLLRNFGGKFRSARKILPGEKRLYCEPVLPKPPWQLSLWGANRGTRRKPRLSGKRWLSFHIRTGLEAHWEYPTENRTRNLRGTNEWLDQFTYNRGQNLLFTNSPSPLNNVGFSSHVTWKQYI